MPQTAEVAVLIGGMAFAGLALSRIIGILGLAANASTSMPVQVSTEGGAVKRGSMLFIMNRQVIVYATFGALSLFHAKELTNTSLGFSTLVAMALFLLVKAIEHVFIPEVRALRANSELGFALIGGVSYVWALASGI